MRYENAINAALADAEPVTGEPWPDLLPLTDEADKPLLDAARLFGAVPRLPDYIGAVATAYQVDPALVAAPVLSGLGLGCAGAVRVRLSPEWVQPAAIYALAIADPGEKKSPIVREVTRPVYAFQRDLAEQFAEPLEKHRLALKKLDRDERKALSSNADDADEQLEEIARERSRMPELSDPRLIAQDVTPEKLIHMLHMNGGIMALVSSEFGAIANFFGRYSTGGGENLDVLLCGHESDHIDYDRKGSGSITIDSPVLNVFSAVQPGGMQLLLSRVAVDRGLLARFMYFTPSTLKGSRSINPPPVPEPLRAWWRRLLSSLLRLPRRGRLTLQEGRLSSMDCEPVDVPLSVGAAKLFNEYREQHERQLTPIVGALDGTGGWAEKLPGAIARIALLLELAAQADNLDGTVPDGLTVGAVAMESAIRWPGYLVPAFRAATSQGDRVGVLARRTVAWLVGQGTRTVSARDMFAARRCADARKMADFRPVIDDLIDRGYLRPASDSGGPGRPGELLEVNPVLFSGQYTKHNTRRDEP